MVITRHGTGRSLRGEIPRTVDIHLPALLSCFFSSCVLGYCALTTHSLFVFFFSFFWGWTK